MDTSRIDAAFAEKLTRCLRRLPDQQCLESTTIHMYESLLRRLVASALEDMTNTVERCRRHVRRYAGSEWQTPESARQCVARRA